MIFQLKIEEIMTLKHLIDELLITASTEKNINFVGAGDIYDLNNIPDIDYSVFYITVGTTQMYENYCVYTLNLFYVDRLVNEATDLNRLKIQSDGMLHLTNILNRLNYTEDVTLSYPLQFTCFNQRFADDCAGVFCTVQITADNLGICEY